jgi:hypothetical protein
MSVEPESGKVIWPIGFSEEDYRKVCNCEAVVVRGMGEDPVVLYAPYNAIKPFLDGYKPPGDARCPEFLHVFFFKKRLDKPYKTVSNKECFVQPVVSPRGWFIVPRDESKGADFIDSREFTYASYKYERKEE